MILEEGKEKSVKNISKNTPEVITNEEMFKAMQKQINELKALKAVPESESTADILKQLVSELKQKPDSEKYGGEDSYTRPEDIDPSDILEEGVTFFSHQVAYVIADDKRDGHNVRTPFGRAIKFTYQSTRQVKTGNETRLHNLSTYTSYSKTEVEWIESHKFFGTIFFSSHKKAFSTDAVKASRLAKIIITLQRYDVHKVVKKAKGLGIEPSEDINALRIAIANMQAENEMVAEAKSNQIRVREAVIEGEILKEPVK